MNSTARIPDTPPVARRLLSVVQAAAYLGVSRSTFYTLGIGKVHVAGCVRYDVEDLAAYVRTHKGEDHR